METPPRFEDEHPESAKVLAAIANRGVVNPETGTVHPGHPVIRSLSVDKCVLTLRLWNGSMRTVRPEPNDPCCCGSGKKFKKCCARRL